VKECWLVLGREKQIAVYRRTGKGQFAERTVHGPGTRLTSTAVPSFAVEVSQLLGPAF
jgi:Uma2 family endonuclease